MVWGSQAVDVDDTEHVGARTMVLEDDPFTRISIVAAMRRFGFDVVSEESTPSATLQAARTVNPQLALLDLHLGSGATGIDVAHELRKLNPRIGIVLLTSYADPRLLNSTLPNIPAGTVYMTKQSVEKMTSLKEAAEKSLEFHGWGNENRSAPAFGRLTDVQVETLRLVARGLSNSEIAARRFVNEKSIEQTISRVAKALEIKSTPSTNQRVHIARIYFRAIGVNINASEE